MIWKKDKNIQSGFLLQKDVYTTNLLYEHNKFPIINNKLSFPFRKVEDEEEIIDPSPYLTFYNQKRNCKSISSKKVHKLKFPLPKAEIPFSSNIDFYKHLRGDVKLRYMDDDLNITSRKGKKIEYSFKDNGNKLIFDNKENNLNTNYFILHYYTPKKRNNTTYNAFYPLRKNIELINESLKIINKRKKIILKDNMFKTQIQMQKKM
jgi:hypothetical protein